jgi:PilZ domain-containing protein
MAQTNQGQVERRRAARAALHLSATLRDGTRKAPARVIDMSTHGCRVECSTVVADGSWVWLGIDGLQNQRCRVVWHCEEYVGLEFETALSDAVFERLLQSQQELTESSIRELRNIASRTHFLARKAGDNDIANLAEISRQCAENAVVEGLRLTKRSAGK